MVCAKSDCIIKNCRVIVQNVVYLLFSDAYVIYKV